MVKVLNSGLFSTIQDLGRIGFKKFGMPPAGVMDKFAYEISQFLVQNDEFDGVIETTLMGVTLEFFEEMFIAVTGAKNELFINDIKCELWMAHKVKKGDILSLKTAKNGARNYIAFSKKLALKRINGSLSTYTKSGIGGFKGRALKNGDEIYFESNQKIYKDITLPKEQIPKYQTHEVIKVVLGPEDNEFTETGMATFLSEKYFITQNSDRMGYRLDGPKIKHKADADILSNAVFFGSVQVPNDGLPIILMADAQTTGGYTKIATVLPSELSKLAQLKGGNSISFEAITQNEAAKIEIEHQKRMLNLKQKLKNQITFYDVNINGNIFNVVVKEL